MALFTKTTIATPDELDSIMRLGEGVIVYVSPAAFTWSIVPENRKLAMSIEHRVNLNRRLGN